MSVTSKIRWYISVSQNKMTGGKKNTHTYQLESSSASHGYGPNMSQPGVLFGDCIGLKNAYTIPKCWPFWVPLLAIDQNSYYLRMWRMWICDFLECAHSMYMYVCIYIYMHMWLDVIMWCRWFNVSLFLAPKRFFVLVWLHCWTTDSLGGETIKPLTQTIPNLCNQGWQWHHGSDMSWPTASVWNLRAQSVAI